jgi:heat shock protein HslJ
MLVQTAREPLRSRVARNQSGLSSVDVGMRRWFVSAVVVALLAAAGCGSNAGQASRTAADVRQDRSEHSLTGTEWQLTSVVEPSRTWRPPPEVDAVLRFDGEGHFSATVCNHYSGPVRIDAGLLRLGQVFRTDMGCSGPRGEVEAAFVAVMDGEVRWATGGDELRLDKPDGRGLRFGVRDTIYPSRELRPLLQGRRDGGDYRFGWQAGETGIGLEFEWRDGPGKPWGFAGMNRPPAWAVSRPDLLTGSAGRDGFVFGVVARATARVVCQPPAGQPPVELQLFTVPGARTWRAFGGFVDQPRNGSVVIAFDGGGHELGRSHRLTF